MPGHFETHRVSYLSTADMGIGSSGTYQTRIDDIDIHTQIHRHARADPSQYRIDNAPRANIIDIIRADPQKPLPFIILVVFPPEQPAPEPSMHGRPVQDQSLVGGDPEHTPVRELALRARPRTRVFLRVPRIQMRIEMHHRHGPPIDPVQRPERGQRDAVIAAQGQEFGLGVRGVDLGGGAGAEFEEGGCHLVQGEGVVEGGDGDVAAVEDCVGGMVGV